jgi:flagellin
MVINTNLQAQVSADSLKATQTRLSKSLARLSSGSKIVSPSDDAAGLAVSSRLNAQIARSNAASQNITNALSFLQTQDGYLGEVAKALNRMSELSVLAQDSTKSNADRDLYQAEFVQLAQYVSDVGSKDFNGLSLFSGSTLDVTIDPEGTPLPITGIDLTSGAYSVINASSVSTTTAAVAALTNIKAAIDQLATDRANLGAFQSRLNYTADELMVSKQNLTAAQSAIQDVDVAEESTEYAKENILLQSGTAMLAQANQLPQTVLKLLQ